MSEFNTFEFKRKLQERCLASPESYRAVEAIGDACGRLHAEGVDVDTAGTVLLDAAVVYVIFNDTPEETWHYCQYMAEKAARMRETIEEVMDEMGIERPES